VPTLVPYHPAHLPGIYRVCMDAAEPGWDTTMPTANPDLLGHVYAGPYPIYSPELATVVVDELGVAGYILATASSNDFWQWQQDHWWPTLRDQYPRISETSWDATIIELFHQPPRSPEHVADSFPAHFHIDLLPRAQGLGLGRTLIESLTTTLRSQRSPGVHLDVGKHNTNAIDFYRHLGFSTVEESTDSLFMAQAL